MIIIIVSKQMRLMWPSLDPLNRLQSRTMLLIRVGAFHCVRGWYRPANATRAALMVGDVLCVLAGRHLSTRAGRTIPKVLAMPASRRIQRIVPNFPKRVFECLPFWDNMVVLDLLWDRRPHIIL